MTRNALYQARHAARRALRSYAARPCAETMRHIEATEARVRQNEARLKFGSGVVMARVSMAHDANGSPIQ